MNNNKTLSPKVLARIGVLGALAAILFVWPEIPVLPGIYKIDFSNIPVMLAGFSMGIVPGTIVLLIKDLTGLAHTDSMIIGEVADFLMSFSMMAVSVLFYRKRKSRKNAALGMLLGTVAMLVVGALLNYYVLIPFYAQCYKMPVEAIVDIFSGLIPAVDTLFKGILLVTIPFNLLKGFLIGIVVFLIYKPLSPILKSSGR